MYRDNTRFEFQGIKKWLKQGEYIISTISESDPRNHWNSDKQGLAHL